MSNLLSPTSFGSLIMYGTRSNGGKILVANAVLSRLLMSVSSFGKSGFGNSFSSKNILLKHFKRVHIKKVVPIFIRYLSF